MVDDKLSYKSVYFIKIEFIICFLIIFFTIIKKTNLTSLFFALSFVILFIWLLYILFCRKFNKSNFTNLLLLFAIILLSLISVGYSAYSLPLTFDYYKKHIMFCSTVIYLFIISMTDINQKTLEFVLKINICIAIVYILFYFFGDMNLFANKYITFNFYNPNITAMFILQTILYNFIAINFYKKKRTKLICLACILFLAYFIYRTGSRTCLLSLFMGIVFMLFFVKEKKRKIKNYIASIIILSPIFIAILYLIMINSGYIKIFNFMVSEGKTADSRFAIWNFAFDAILNHPVFGAYYQISDGTGISQMHNTHIDVWASYGSIVFILLMIYIIRIVNDVNKRCETKMQKISLVAFFTVIIMGMGEAALFSGGQGIYILSCSFLLFAKYDFNNKLIVG